MLSEVELAELAEDIKAHGLREPIVAQRVDGEAMLLDGRHRRLACQMVGITPALKWLEPDEDPVKFIYSRNVAWRHLTKGQKAMVTAKLFPQPKRGMHSELKISTGNFDKADLSRARTILHHAPDLVDGVLSGATPLDAAYKSAVKQRDQGNPDRAQRKKPRPPKEAKPNAGSSPDDGKEASVADTGSTQPQRPPDTEEDILPDHFTEDQLQEAFATITKGLPVSTEKRIEKALKRLLQKMRNQFNRDLKVEVAEQVAEQVSEEKDRLSMSWQQVSEAQAKVDEAWENYWKAEKNISNYITEEEYRRMRGLLHSDRHQAKSPKEQEKYDKALETLLRLEAKVPTKMYKHGAETREWFSRYKANRAKQRSSS